MKSLDVIVNLIATTTTTTALTVYARLDHDTCERGIDVTDDVGSCM